MGKWKVIRLLIALSLVGGTTAYAKDHSGEQQKVDLNVAGAADSSVASSSSPTDTSGDSSDASGGTNASDNSNASNTASSPAAIIPFNSSNQPNGVLQYYDPVGHRIFTYVPKDVRVFNIVNKVGFNLKNSSQTEIKAAYAQAQDAARKLAIKIAQGSYSSKNPNITPDQLAKFKEFDKSLHKGDVNIENVNQVLQGAPDWDNMIDYLTAWNNVSSDVQPQLAAYQQLQVAAREAKFMPSAFDSLMDMNIGATYFNISGKTPRWLLAVLSAVPGAGKYAKALQNVGVTFSWVVKPWKLTYVDVSKDGVAHEVHTQYNQIKPFLWLNIDAAGNLAQYDGHFRIGKGFILGEIPDLDSFSGMFGGVSLDSPVINVNGKTMLGVAAVSPVLAYYLNKDNGIGATAAKATAAGYITQVLGGGVTRTATPTAPPAAGPAVPPALDPSAPPAAADPAAAPADGVTAAEAAPTVQQVEQNTAVDRATAEKVVQAESKAQEIESNLLKIQSTVKADEAAAKAKIADIKSKTFGLSLNVKLGAILDTNSLTAGNVSSPHYYFELSLQHGLQTTGRAHIDVGAMASTQATMSLFVSKLATKAVTVQSLMTSLVPDDSGN